MLENIDSLETPIKSPRKMACMIDNNHELASTQVTKSYTQAPYQKRKYQLNQSPIAVSGGPFLQMPDLGTV